MDTNETATQPLPTFNDQQRIAVLPNGRVIRNFHLSVNCESYHCPVHNPSDHFLRSKVLDYDFQRGMFVRFSIDNDTVIVLPDPDDYNFNMYGEAIMLNSLTCNECNIQIYSDTPYNRYYCDCGKTSVNGGYYRLMHGGDNYTDHSIIIRKGKPALTVMNKALVDLTFAQDETKVHNALVDERFFKNQK